MFVIDRTHILIVILIENLMSPVVSSFIDENAKSIKLINEASAGKAAGNAAVNTKGLHVAVLMSGGRDKFSDVKLVKSNVDFFYSQLDAKVSTVLCLQDPEGIEANYSVIYHFDQYYRMEACYEEARLLETEHGFTFSHFIRTRPDMQWHAPLLPLRKYSPDAVSVRTRAVIFKPPQQIADDAFSWERAACCYAKDIPSSGFGIKQCALLDDQIFVVPAHLADAAFRGSQYISLPTTNASLESYGTNRALYLKTCDPVFHVGREMILTRRFIERNVPYQITAFSGRNKHRPFSIGKDPTALKPCGL